MTFIQSLQRPIPPKGRHGNLNQWFRLPKLSSKLVSEFHFWKQIETNDIISSLSFDDFCFILFLSLSYSSHIEFCTTMVVLRANFEFYRTSSDQSTTIVRVNRFWLFVCWFFFLLFGKLLDSWKFKYEMLKILHTEARK